MSKPHPFLPNLDEKITSAMLRQIGVSAIDDLYSDVPSQFMLKRELRIPPAVPESSLRREIQGRLSRDSSSDALCFLGGGVWPHYVPSVVDAIISRQEFYTSYTPYQPEISQGMLQALFEYQSLMSDLLGMQICNSSMYDWASAAGEAVRMAWRVNKRRSFLVAASVGPQRLEVIRTYVEPLGLTLKTVDFDRRTGEIDSTSLSKSLDDHVAGIYFENPNYFGVVEEKAAEVMDAVHRAGGLGVVGVDPMSLSLLKEPGTYGADVAVGEGQPLGISMNYGGPHIGIFAVSDIRLARNMPGRLIGATTTKDGKERAYCMVLQTREQHIRREAANSNICTNQALLALAASVYLSLLGKTGFSRLGEVILSNSHYAAKRLAEIKGLKAPLFDGPFFKEFAVGYTGGTKAYDVYHRLAKDGILGGFPLDGHLGLGEAATFCVTEVHSGEDIERLAHALEGAV